MVGSKSVGTHPRRRAEVEPISTDGCNRGNDTQEVAGHFSFTHPISKASASSTINLL